MKLITNNKVKYHPFGNKRFYEAVEIAKKIKGQLIGFRNSHFGPERSEVIWELAMKLDKIMNPSFHKGKSYRKVRK